jgi:predicted transcriptional regulator
MSASDNKGMSARTTIRMNPGLRRRMMELAEKEGRTFTDLVEEAAALLIKRREGGAEQVARVSLPVATGQIRLPEGMTLEQYIKRVQSDEDAEWIRRTLGGNA